MKQYIVDAFTDCLFSGNPAAVCMTDRFPDESMMQSIAAENNLSETVFAVMDNGTYHLRWFTPKSEVDFCGHATLAAAFIIFSFYDTASETLSFRGQTGEFHIARNGGSISMTFPAYRTEHIEITDTMIEALGTVPLAAYKDRDILFVLRDENEVIGLQPDMAQLSLLDGACIAVTARGKEYDCVSRVFAPRFGISEDPVTGSAHCMIAPYWCRRLGKENITAFQASERTGVLYCEVTGDRVIISGKAVLFSEADIKV